jgi:ataxia telangiectasia mutated family protein
MQASWTSQMRLKPSDFVIQELLEPAVENLRQGSTIETTTAGTVYFQYATFCTTQLEDQHSIADMKRMESLYKSKQLEVLQYADPIRDAQQRGNKNILDRLVRDRDKADKLQQADKAELQRLHNMQHTFLQKAIDNFLRCFAACDDFDQHVPKFCAIWLKHSKKESLYTIVADLLRRVPTYKFLPLMHQLCSRLSNDPDGFQASLYDLIARICMDHPLHSLYQIFSTMSGVDGDDQVSKSRSRAASRLVDQLCRAAKPKAIASSTRILFDAYSDLADATVPKELRNKPQHLLTDYSGVRHFRNLQSIHLPPPSLALPIRPDHDYTNLPYVQKYDSSFKLAGGINQPKILDSLLSDGSRVRELVRLILFQTYTFRSKVAMMTFIRTLSCSKYFNRWTGLCRETEKLDDVSCEFGRIKLFPSNGRQG